MNFTRGQKLYFSDGEHEIVGVENDVVFLERLGDQSIRKYTKNEAESLILDNRKKGWYQGPWPFTISYSVYDGEWTLDEHLFEMGISEVERNMFKSPIGDLDVELEIHRNGDVFLLSVNDIKLSKKIKTSS